MSGRQEDGQAQPTNTQPERRPPKRNVVQIAQLDMLELLARFLLQAREGKPLTFTTFKEIWQEIGFSYIFEVIKFI